MTNYCIDPTIIKIQAETSTDLTGCLGNPYLGCNVELRTKEGTPVMLKGKTFTSSLEVIRLAGKAKNIPKNVKAYFIFDDLEPVMPEEGQQYHLFFTVYDLSVQGNDSYLAKICTMRTVPFHIQFVNKWVNNPKEFGGSTAFTRKLGDKTHKSGIGLKLRVYNVPKSRVRRNELEEFALPTGHRPRTQSTPGEKSPQNMERRDACPRPAVPNDVFRRGSEDSADSSRNEKPKKGKSKHTDINEDVKKEVCNQPEAIVAGPLTTPPAQFMSDLPAPWTRPITQTMDDMALEPSTLPPIPMQPEYAHQPILPSLFPGSAEPSQAMYNNTNGNAIFNGQEGHLGMFNNMEQTGMGHHQQSESIQAYTINGASTYFTRPSQLVYHTWQPPPTEHFQRQQEAQEGMSEMDSYQWLGNQYAEQQPHCVHQSLNQGTDQGLDQHMNQGMNPGMNQGDNYYPAGGYDANVDFQYGDGQVVS
jgi:hypothetical protein